MTALKVKYHIKEMAEYLKVSRSAYYRWVKYGESAKARQDTVLKVRIRVLFDESGKTYGAKRIALDLQAEGFKCGKFRTLRLMKELGLTPKAKRKFKATTDSNHKKGFAPNLLRQNFFEPAPDRAWVGDITYVWTHEGVALSGGCDRPLLAQSRWLGDERPYERGLGYQRVSDGGEDQEAVTMADLPLGSRQAVL